MNKLSTAKLYARLMSENYSILAIKWANRGYGCAYELNEYLTFLRKNRKHGDAYCPYNRALKLIGAQ